MKFMAIKKGRDFLNTGVCDKCSNACGRSVSEMKNCIEYEKFVIGDKIITDLEKENQSSCRISKDDYYLKIAEAVLLRSTCLRRKYGAVIVQNDVIVSTGYNGSPRGMSNCCDTGMCQREQYNVPKGERYELCVAIHAEDNAISAAGRSKCLGATLYICGKEKDGSYAKPNPCLMCARKIINSGIVRVCGRGVDGSIINIK